ncbi:hypothetical protein F4604DRAFT_1928864 [Suillus subluteus]|nr:hypothetical protein F4604DRAFT_1928864 [Suillus subluteus]
MSRPFIRNLTFQSNDLSKEATIMLALINGNLKGPLRGLLPDSLEGQHIREDGRATYTNQLAFSKTQVVNGNVISAGTCVKINPPQAGTSGVLQAVNKTGAVQDLAVGFLNKGDLMPTPALYFNEVGDESSVKAQFTPILRVYITSDFQETAILRGAIDTPAIWTQDLAALAENTTWNLKHDTATGRYTVVQA